VDVERDRRRVRPAAGDILIWTHFAVV
jgi:hypothetical protein